MKKNLAIVLALALVLCLSAASAVTFVNGNYEQIDGKTHNFYANTKDVTTWTTLSCNFQATETKTVTAKVKVGNADAHKKTTTVYTAGICKDCKKPMNDKTVKIDGVEFKYHLMTVTEAVEAHTLIRGAYMGQKSAKVNGQYTAHNDYTHLYAYDQYEAVCSVCQEKVTENVPVYKAHTFATKAVTYDKDGKAAPQKKFGNTCTECGYTRVYKDLTTAAAQAVMEIIAAYEDAGMTVEFDADQLIAVGIEEGEVGEVEGCGVATIQFSNWTPVKKNDTGKQVIDNGYTTAVILTSTEKNADGTWKNTASSIKTTDQVSYSDGTKEAVKNSDKVKANKGIVSVETKNKAVNFNQEARTYGAAYVTMTVDGTAHRVYFYNRHDKNGWVYAFEADMIENTAKTTGNLVRCGAGQEYASVGAVNKGAKMDFIGIGYESEGYNTSWNWGMISDFEFVCIGK